MIALGPREITKAVMATVLVSTFLHIGEQVIAGLVAAQWGILP